jgi:hypothetical protein
MDENPAGNRRVFDSGFGAAGMLPAKLLDHVAGFLAVVAVPVQLQFDLSSR